MKVEMQNARQSVRQRQSVLYYLTLGMAVQPRYSHLPPISFSQVRCLH